ncbi:sulfur carrier protein ThiS [Paenibacillus sp. IHBB 10380]|uniref:sulfur carrier protein ThiS n=1 Tax=Paenibacillus sp. IHBB 10380 TaxID=1566358 RepID=UPI0005CFC0E3|nr:sulfur carrier protein ThiS [Paenibacillus sp. IHBB 10380]AJS59288.1 thiamine biosynthesis protein ThiS [Paenibacillus sp. IHBB 10380]
MKLQINGEQVEVPDTQVTTITDLLTHFGLDNKVVIVECNQQILEKSSHSETLLSDGDRVEIVHFVGGG